MFKIVVETPEASFSREFSNIKTLRQFQRRNVAIKNASVFTFHNNRWERFVIYGSQVIPETVLRNLLNSCIGNACPCINETPDASPTNHLTDNPINFPKNEEHP